MKVLIICPAKIPATGNVSTVQRIQDHLISENIECLVRDVSTVATDDTSCSHKQLQKFAVREEIDGILFLHAFKGTRILNCSFSSTKKCKCQTSKFPVPYGIIFGGTDLNLDIHDVEKRSSMQEILKQANFAVAFTDTLKNKAVELVSNLKVFVQPQAIEIPECSFKSIDPNDNFLVNSNSSCSNKTYVFLMATGVRPVKDPLYILNVWIELCQKYKNLNLKLLILAPILDKNYAETFFQVLKSLKEQYLSGTTLAEDHQSFDGLDGIFTWVNLDSLFPILYAPPLSCEDFSKLMSSSQIFASINTSESEGMSSAILESMANKIPVIARDIDGNKAVITERKTGLLFHRPEDFAKQVLRLLTEHGLREKLVSDAFDMILEHHSIAREKSFYKSLCIDYFSHKVHGVPKG